MRHLGVIVGVRAGRPGMKFCKWETEDGVSDDSDNEVITLPKVQIPKHIYCN